MKPSHDARIVNRLEESCDIGIVDRNEVLIVEVVRSPHGHALATALWKRLPIHATASGKLLLAHLPSAEVNEVLAQPLPAFTPHTITDPSELRQQLALIRRQGYAMDNEEFEMGVRGVSAPIWGIDGRLVAALGVPGPAGRITDERASSIASALTEAAANISAASAG
ncbi:MAG: IclR family transcriptional regulator [Anaerolineales bacterium]|nr:IclR family transcriptional regulator [Anaerolineales bacterium]